ncbi:MAG: transposase [Chitinispirillaceae bacterium]|nr:transposase [Chitinispirillaceae bacterium]
MAMPQPAEHVVHDIWLPAAETAFLLGISIRHLRRKCEAGDFVTRLEHGNGGAGYRVALSSLPDAARLRYASKSSGQVEALDDDSTADLDDYSSAPEYNRRKADKYATLLRQFEGLKGTALRNAIAVWNDQHPEMSTSYVSICNARSKRISLVGLWGSRCGSSSVDQWSAEYDYFKGLFLIEGGPSLFTCWRKVRGYALSNGKSVDEFPRPQAFKRKLDREVSASSQYLARCGHAAWNRKYASFVSRDYSALSCGEVWVSDHAQIDVAVLCKDGKVRFPWVTAWCDFKSGKFLGWMVHADDPNSDHIFLSFYYAAMKFGRPTDVIIDNGKDYRCRDFAGTRRIRVSGDEIKTTSMLSHLKITRHFALPYNAQTKPIERRFREIKEQFSKHMVGYRGGNVTERPEKLKKEIRDGAILTIDEFSGIFDDFIEMTLNRSVSMGKNLLGQSPDQLWSKEFTVKREVGKDELRLFCMRTSEPVTIGRNGAYDSNLGVTYWGEWMAACKGTKVYLRRDPRDYAEAWVFSAANDEYMGMARDSMFNAPALARTEVEHAQYRSAQAAKNRSAKIERAYIDNLTSVKPMEKMMYSAAACAIDGAAPDDDPKIISTDDTEMGRVIKQRSAEEADRVTGGIAPDIMRDDSRVYMYEYQKYEDELKEAV